MKRLRSNLTYANVIATLALFLALSGATAFAASQLGKNSVGSKQLKKNSVTAAKIKNGAVTQAKISSAAQTALKGATGPLGPQGPPGAAGNGVLVRDANGALIGELIDDPSVASLGGPTVVTPGGYALTLGWDGSLPARPPNIPYALPNCQGPAYLGTGAGSETVTTSTKRLVYEIAPGTFEVPARPTSSVTGIGSYEEGSSCSNINSLTYAWPLKAVSRTATGLPATIVGPIELATS